MASYFYYPPRWLSSRESACNAETGSIPGSGRSPRGGNGNTLQYSCLENLMNRGAWQATVQRVTKNQTRMSTHTVTYYFQLIYTTDFPKFEHILISYYSLIISYLIQYLILIVFYGCILLYDLEILWWTQSLSSGNAFKLLLAIHYCKQCCDEMLN